MNTIETLKQALEALEKLEYSSTEGWCKRYPTEQQAYDAVTALSTLIEQMEKAEPVGWIGEDIAGARWLDVFKPAEWRNIEVQPLYLHPAIPAPINEREEFEKWWDDPLSPMGNTGPYAEGTTMQWSWEAWQARAVLGDKKAVEKEREACAKVCDNLQAGNDWHGTKNTPKDCAIKIRERSNEHGDKK